MAPSKLAIATSAVKRLVKEEASYHKELEQQEARIKKLEGGSEDENAEYQLKQERRALDETKAVIEPVRQSIKDAVARLEDQLAAVGPTPSEEVTKANEVILEAKQVVGNV